VLLSRWKVDDAATALQMRFDQNVLCKRDELKKPLGRAEALREAKTWLRTPAAQGRREGAGEADRRPAARRAARSADCLRGRGTPKGKDDVPFEQPDFWAAFVLLGDPD
jgi:CHAT domain-containing protein